MEKWGTIRYSVASGVCSSYRVHLPSTIIYYLLMVQSHTLTHTVQLLNYAWHLSQLKFIAFMHYEFEHTYIAIYTLNYIYICVYKKLVA